MKITPFSLCHIGHREAFHCVFTDGKPLCIEYMDVLYTSMGKADDEWKLLSRACDRKIGEFSNRDFNSPSTKAHGMQQKTIGLSHEVSGYS